MVKRKYLKFILLNILLSSWQVQASSAWLPEHKKYKLSFSYSHIDQVAEKRQLARIVAYREIDQSIDHLLAVEKAMYAQKDLQINLIKENKKLKPVIKQQKIELLLFNLKTKIAQIDAEINRKVEILKRLSAYQNRLYNKNTIEYGLTDNLSLGVANSNNRNHFLASKYTRAESNGGATEIFMKFKVFQNKKYVISLQPKYYLETISGAEQQAFAEISLLTGKTYKGRFGEVFIEGWVGFGRCISYSCSSKSYSHYSVSEGYKMPFGLMFTNFTRYYFRKNYGEIYDKTIYNQLSIAKEVNFNKLNRSKLTFQLGYFIDHSINSRFAKYYNVSGSVFSIWLDI